MKKFQLEVKHLRQSLEKEILIATGKTIEGELKKLVYIPYEECYLIYVDGVYTERFENTETLSDLKNIVDYYNEL